MGKRRAYVVARAAWIALGLAASAHAAHDDARQTGTRVVHDVAYGSDPRQRFDVYLPPSPRHSPVIFMVHGGAWAIGDKIHPGVVDAKAAYWLPKNYVLISVNYRLLPEAKPLEQANDVARALAAAQRSAASWGADPNRFVLMGHSAGAHLVAGLGANPALLSAAGAVRPRGIVSLDSAAMDVVQIMEFPRHPRLYDRAFGENPSDWAAASPYHQLRSGALPMLAVCSSRRFDACPQARRLAQKAATLGARIDVLPQDLSHAEINRTLGQLSDYTASVNAFIAGLVAL
jgi:acetyl esterase/lipase